MMMVKKNTDILVGVVGFGYWGPNIVRNFNAIEGVQVVTVCDKDPTSLKRVQQMYPGMDTTLNYQEMISKRPIDMVAIVTPVYTHFELAKLALKNGKHVFVEKPFTSSAVQAEELIEMAEKKNLKILVDHTFLFTGAVNKIKELIDDGTLGNLFYYDSMRVNLGLFQHDVNVIWDLAPHDLSIMDFIIDEKPEAVSASGKIHFGCGLEDIAFITVYFSNNLIAHFNVNWISPVKIRTTLIGGENRMLVWNDLDADEKIKVYDKGVQVNNSNGIYDLLVSYRSGDMWAPRLKQMEALKVEADYSINCILNDEKPINDGYAGLRVVKMLEASNQSIKNKGKMIKL
jgi:predicted dehydrogenase